MRRLADVEFVRRTDVPPSFASNHEMQSHTYACDLLSYCGRKSSDRRSGAPPEDLFWRRAVASVLLDPVATTERVSYCAYPMSFLPLWGLLQLYIVLSELVIVLFVFE